MMIIWDVNVCYDNISVNTGIIILKAQCLYWQDYQGLWQSQSYKQSQVCLFVYMDGISLHWQSQPVTTEFEGNAPVKQHGDTDPAWGRNYRNEIIFQLNMIPCHDNGDQSGNRGQTISSNIAWILLTSDLTYDYSNMDIPFNITLAYRSCLQIILLHTCLHNFTTHLKCLNSCSVESVSTSYFSVSPSFQGKSGHAHKLFLFACMER